MTTAQVFDLHGVASRCAAFKMPRMDGFQVLQWIRNQPGISEIAVIVLTSTEQAWEINTAYSIARIRFS